ncbi:AAA family ATPase [Cohnella mopanensis]|uniref:AAA family ATPase n=1 Tax=Cohnella mopanensis TaxID=2911966 RepID=UPI001EF77C59|nr:AAA family ATPase [Cohnella mopanensis]
MKIKWFQILNFRSITDSGKCYMNEDITIFAGKNESGKSNILKALDAFDKESFDEDIDYPNNIQKNEPQIIVCYSILLNEIQQIYASHLNFELDYPFDHSPKEKFFELIVTKNKNGIKQVSGNWSDIIEPSRVGELKYWAKQFENKVKDLNNDSTLTQELINNLNRVVSNKNAILEINKILQSEIEKEPQYKNNSKIIELLSDYDNYKLFQKIPKQEEMIGLIKLPKMILFNSFTDLLPDKVEETIAVNSTIVKRFFNIVDIKIESIFSETSKQKRKQLVNKASAKITGDFTNFYKQNEVKLTIDIDGSELSFFLYDGDRDDPFKPEQRSQGFQWFLSFYITLMAEKLSDENIILIDEPGLYLHAKAQEDMLRVLEAISEKNQILFTTHSPYLIDTNRLDRVRLVIKENTETRVESKFHKIADKDTLTPIITAIGYDLSKGIAISTELNIVTEGISDYYYLMAMRNYLKIPSSKVTFIPAVGVDQVPNISSILVGWGVPILCLLDNDSQGKGVARKLKDKLGFEEGKEYIFVSDSKIAIEDLFSKEDFLQHILLENDSIDQNQNNSNLASHKGKVIISRSFFERIQSNDLILSEETIKNFVAIFNRMQILIPEHVSV